MGKIIGILLDGEPTYHVGNPGYHDYDSLCGIDANDGVIGHGGVIPVPKGQKITCGACKAIYFGTLALKLKKSNFA